MESASLNRHDKSQISLESTTELPTLQAQDNVDIYLPQQPHHWNGPALQQPIEVPAPGNGEQSPLLTGMLNPVDTTFSYPSTDEAASKPIRSYARRSTRRGLLLTIGFLLLAVSSAVFLYFKIDDISRLLFSGIN